MTKSKQLQLLYNSLPRLNCKELCYKSCGPIPVFAVEAKRVLRLYDTMIKTNTVDLSCSMLTPDNKCAIYADRPLICRLYGVVESMKCPHGCVPEGGWITDDQAHHLLRRLSKIDNSEADVDLPGLPLGTARG